MEDRMPVEFKLPDLGEGIHEGEIIEVLVHVGDKVEDGQTVLIVETDKATAEAPSPVTGTVKEIRVKPGQTVRVGEVLMVFLREDEIEEKEEKEEAKALPSSVFPPPSSVPVAAAPSTRRLARQLGIDINLVKPTGPGGRVTEEDIRAFAESSRQPEAKIPPVFPQPPLEKEGEERAPFAAPPPEAPPLPEFERLGRVERIPLRSVRRTTAKNVAMAWSQIPHVTHTDTADLTKLESFRRKHKEQAEEKGGILSLTVFAITAAASALKKFPFFNSSVDMESEEIILKHYHNIGFAVDTDRGLLVPVIRDVDCKSIFDLAVELKALTEKTRQGKATRDELSGGTFTITNVGPMGGTGLSPIIRHPEVAILAMGQARLQPVVVGDEKNYEIVPRLIMPLGITFDHRVLDGAEAARFLNTIIGELQDPELLMMS
jgi:pyruvate dehydrogenase E2 component (dihydrolipoamide acetyltransferase)